MSSSESSQSLKYLLKLFAQKFADKILQKHLLCISSELLLYIYFWRFQYMFFSTDCKSVRIYISGPYFPAFRLKTPRYGVSLGIQRKCGKCGPKKLRIWTLFKQCGLLSKHFSRAVILTQALVVSRKKNFYSFSRTGFTCLTFIVSFFKDLFEKCYSVNFCLVV